MRVKTLKRHAKLVSPTVSVLLENPNLDMSNPTDPRFKCAVADAIKATEGSQKNDWYDESLRETIRAEVTKRKHLAWLTDVIKKTAIAVA